MTSRPPHASLAPRPNQRTSELAATILRTEGQKRPGHSEHFLSRTLRLEGAEQDRAMRLYHHSVLVQQCIAEQMKDRPEERAAIALGDEDRCAHVIVTRSGLFVTCLSAMMSVGDAAILSYLPLEEAMDRADAQHQATMRRKQQLGRLSADELSRALAEGPGHVHREMVEVLEMEPQTYLVAVARTFFKSLTLAARYQELRTQVGLRQENWERLCRLQGTATLCFSLFGAMDTTLVSDTLQLYLDFDGPNLEDVAAALARHKGGARILLSTAEKTASLAVRRVCHKGALWNCLRHPRAWPLFLRELHKVEKGGLGRGPVMAGLFDSLVGVEPRRLEALFALGNQVMLPMVPEVADPTWLLTADEHQDHALRRLPVSAMFPPRESAAAARLAFHRWVKNTPMPAEVRPPPKRPVVRGTPRVGRNDPCPCRSGKKHKHCCEGSGQEKDKTR